TRIREIRASAMRAPDRCAIGRLCVCGQIEDVCITAGAEDYGVAGVRLNGSRNEIARDDPFRLSIDNDDVEQLVAIEHLHAPKRDLALQCLEGAQEKLLSGLPACVERPRDLHAAE